jgi:hypothetical protein
VAEVGDGVGAERALGFLDEEAVLMENVEDGAYMTKMVGPCGAPCGAVDEYIIEENQHELAEERPQDVIHESLECRRSVAQPERHDQELVEAVVSAERSLGDILGAHPDLVIA